MEVTEVCPICKSSKITVVTLDTGKNRVCMECDFQWTKGGRRNRPKTAHPRNGLNRGD